MSARGHSVPVSAKKCDCPFDDGTYEYTTHCGCEKCDYPLGYPIAPTSAPKEVSGNMIHARELDITAVTTVSELFELIDLPHRITKHAQLSIVRKSQFSENTMGVAVLRLEWRGEAE